MQLCQWNDNKRGRGREKGNAGRRWRRDKTKQQPLSVNDVIEHLGGLQTILTGCVKQVTREAAQNRDRS